MKKINYFDLGLYKDGLELNEFNKALVPNSFHKILTPSGLIVAK